MARPFMFAALCQRAHPLKHSLAESIFVSRVRKTAKKIFLNRKIRQQGHSLAEVSLYVNYIVKQEYNHIYIDKVQNLKSMKGCGNSKMHISSNFLLSICLIIMLGHLITRTINTLQHFATLHHTSPNYTSLNLVEEVTE